jgi:glycerophosphoryl diester phosphodiesterase
MKKSIIFPLIFCLLIVFTITACSVLNRSSTSSYNPVIAHRGAWKALQLPQNSIASLNQAIALKCYGSEFDVHLTKDNILVVNHDHDFFGINIEQATYEELLTKKLSNGEYIPTAEAYLKAGLKQKHTKLILELKPSKLGKERTEEAAECVINLVKQLKAENMVEYISFSYDALKKIKALEPKAKVAYLAGGIAPQKLKADGIDGLYYHFSEYQKNPTFINEAHQLGLSINAWTVNNPADMKSLIAQKAEYITTDEPELLIKVLKEE